MQTKTRIFIGLLFILAVKVLPAQSPVRTEISIEPGAIFNDGISKCRIKIDLRGKNPNMVSIKFISDYNISFTADGFNNPQVSFPMFDDGTHGDNVANDNIYCIGGIRSILKPQNLYGFELISFAFVIDGTEYPINFMWLPIVQKENFNIRTIDSNTMSSNYAVHLFNLSLEDRENTNKVIHRFYELFPDKYDFILLYRDRISSTSAYYTGVRNDIKGIGLELYNSRVWGSIGQLQGIISIDTKGQRTPMPEDVIMHEFGHRWGSYYKDSLLPLSSIMSHWNASSTITGMMGPCCNNTFQYNGDSTFTHKNFYNYWRFKPIELYTMGVLPVSILDTCELYVLKDPNIDQVFNGNIPTGSIIKPKEFVKVTSDNIEKIYGKREPNFQNSQKSFRTATIILTESQPAEEEICLWNKIIRNYSDSYNGVDFFDYYANRWWGVPSFAYYCKGLVSNNFLISDSTPLFIPDNSIEENKSLDNLVYPNPANNILNIKLIKVGAYSINIITLDGRLIHNVKMDGNLFQIDISSLDKGEYIITIRSEEFFRSKKFIKF